MKPISHNTLPEFRSLVDRFKQQGSLGVEPQPVTDLKDQMTAHLARESYLEFASFARELDWVQGKPKPSESLDSDGREGHYRVDVEETDGLQSGHAEFHANNEAASEIYQLYKTDSAGSVARVLAAVEGSSKDGTLHVLQGDLNGNHMTLQAFHYAPDGSALSQENIERTAKGFPRSN